MTVPPGVDPATGSVALAPETFAVLVQHAVDPAATVAAAQAAEQLDLLSCAGVIDGEAVRPRLEKALAAIVDPQLCTLELQQSGKTMEGWADPSIVALLLPAAEDGRHTLTWLHPSLLPEALARLVDLGPRPRAIRAEPLRLGVGGLDRLLEDGAEAAGAVLGASASTGTLNAASSLAAGLRRRWRLSAAWELDGGERAGAAVEAVDTDAGIWLLEGEGDGLIAWPVTPSLIWRLIVRLVMRRAADGSRGP